MTLTIIGAGPGGYETAVAAMGTGRNDNIIRADFRSAAILCLNRYSVAVLERSLAIYQMYQLVLQQELDTAAKLGNDLVLACHGAADIELEVTCFNTELAGIAQIFKHFSIAA
mgnify:CR=1 FL=1